MIYKESRHKIYACFSKWEGKVFSWRNATGGWLRLLKSIFSTSCFETCVDEENENVCYKTDFPHFLLMAIRQFCDVANMQVHFCGWYE